MDSFEKRALKQEARRRLLAQRQRAGRLRVRVATIALIGFVLFWGVIFAQMATGNDPVLADKPSALPIPPAGEKRAVASEPPAESAEVETEGEGDGDDDSSQRTNEAIEAAEREAAAELEAAEAEAIEVEPAPVTTSQS